MWIIRGAGDFLVSLRHFFFNKPTKLIFLGLDNAGKSTLLHRLFNDTLGILPPTTHPTSHELRIGNVHCTAFDLGGHRPARPFWWECFPKVDGIVFIIDATDPGRFAEARAELNEILSMEQLLIVPILILGNKIDQPGAVSKDELRYDFGIQRFTYRPIELFMCSIAMRQGYAEGLQWLTRYI